MNAVAACISEPSVISPERYFGAPSRSGTTGARTRFAPLSHIIRPCQTITPSQRWTRSEKGHVQALALVVVAANHRDIFGIVLHARELVAQLCFSGGLFLDAAHQRPAQQEHAGRRDRGIDDAGEDHVAGNGIAHHGQGAADDPEDADEGDRGQHGVENAQRHIDQELDRNPAVLGDARFGIVGLGVHDGQLIEMPVREPTTRSMCAPAIDAIAPAGACARAAVPRKMPRTTAPAPEYRPRPRMTVLRVLLFERVKEEFVPAIDGEGRAEIRKEKKQNGGGQKPRLRARLPAPETKREAQEPSETGWTCFCLPTRDSPKSRDKRNGRLNSAWLEVTSAR